MIAGLSTSAVRSTVVIACTVAVLTLLSTSVASSQGVSGTEQQLSALRQQLSALDHRVKELEKTAINVGGQPEAATPDPRIARLEAEVRSLQSEMKAEAASRENQPAQIVAPFVVVDSAGKPILRVTEEGNGFSRGIYVYDSNTLIAGHLGVMQDGTGRVYVTRKGVLPVVVAAATSDGGTLALTSAAGGSNSALKLSVDASGGKVQVFPKGGGSAQAELKATPNGGEFDVYNKQGEAVGWLEATSGGNGKFTIGRAGKIYVEAAVLQNGKGMIIAGPDVGGAPPSLVIPYYLEGRTGH